MSLSLDSLEALAELESAHALCGRLAGVNGLNKLLVTKLQVAVLAQLQAVLGEVAAGLPDPEAAAPPPKTVQEESPTAAWRRARGQRGGDGRDGQAMPTPIRRF